MTGNRGWGKRERERSLTDKQREVDRGMGNKGKDSRDWWRETERERQETW